MKLDWNTRKTLVYVRQLPWYKRVGYEIVGVVRLPYVVIKDLLKT